MIHKIEINWQYCIKMKYTQTIIVLPEFDKNIKCAATSFIHYFLNIKIFLPCKIREAKRIKKYSNFI